MAKNVKIEKIEEGEAAVQTLSASEADMRKLYMRDGIIDATEQDALDRILGKIETARSQIQRLRAEVEQNLQIWNSRSADYGEILSQAQTLADFGHSDAATVQASLEPIAQASSSNDQRWADATAGLDNAVMNVELIWQDYLLKKAARDEYELLRPEADFRLSAAEATGPYTEELSAEIANVRGRISRVDSEVSGGNWVEALSLLRELIALLEPIEVEIARIEAAKSAFEAGLAAFQPRLTEVSTSEYATLDEELQAIAAKQVEMDASVATHDYEAASTHLAQLSSLVDGYLAKRDELDVQRGAYETALATIENRLQAAVTCEFATAGGMQQRIIDAEGEMRKFAESEDFSGALSKLGDVETAVAEYEALADDRDLYEARLASIQDELLEYSTATTERAFLQPIQTQVATIQSAMEAAATAEDFETALAKIGELEAKIGECIDAVNKKKDEYQSARTNLNSQLRAAKSDATDSAPSLDTEMAAITATIPAIDTAAAAEDWVKAKALIQPALDAVAAFNSAMLQAEAPNITNGMSTSAIDLAARSPELVQTMEDLEADGWQVVVGTAGGGSSCDKAAKVLTIDADDFNNDASAVQVMAHETGHAEYEHEPDASTRQKYIDSQLGDEGMATMENIRVQREIIANGGADIGIAGNRTNHAAYNAAYDQYLLDGNVQACRDAMGAIFGKGERTSTTNELYEDYYGGAYDRWIAGGGTPGPSSGPEHGHTH